MKIKYLILLSILSSSVSQAANTTKINAKKLSDDPTRVVTELGITYSDNYDTNSSSWSLTGSIAFDPVKKSMFVLTTTAVNGVWVVHGYLTWGSSTSISEKMNLIIKTLKPITA